MKTTTNHFLFLHFICRSVKLFTFVSAFYLLFALGGTAVNHYRTFSIPSVCPTRVHLFVCTTVGLSLGLLCRLADTFLNYHKRKADFILTTWRIGRYDFFWHLPSLVARIFTYLGGPQSKNKLRRVQESRRRSSDSAGNNFFKRRK